MHTFHLHCLRLKWTVDHYITVTQNQLNFRDVSLSS